MRSNAEQRFYGTVWDKRIYSGMGACFAALLLPAVFLSGIAAVQIVVGVGICVLLWLAWEGRKAGQIVADDDGVRAYGYIRRWHWAWTELDHFSTAVPRSPLASGHEALIAHTRDGRTITMSALNASAIWTKSGREPWVREAAGALNHRLSAN